MPNCVFCKIASGELPKSPQEKKYEDDQFIAFLDIQPKAPGHTILIPKEHSRWFLDIPEELSGNLFRVAQTVGKKLIEEYGADYIHLSVVGTDVPHTHIHLIPRKLQDKQPEI